MASKAKKQVAGTKREETRNRVLDLAQSRCREGAKVLRDGANMTHPRSYALYNLMVAVEGIALAMKTEDPRKQIIAMEKEE